MNLVERAKRLLLTPGPEWQVIDTEPTTTGDLYRQYIIPLAAIGPIARFIGFGLIGIHIPFSGVTYRTPIGRALVGALVSYVLALVGVFVLAMIIDMLLAVFFLNAAVFVPLGEQIGLQFQRLANLRAYACHA